MITVMHGCVLNTSRTIKGDHLTQYMLNIASNYKYDNYNGENCVYRLLH